MPQQDPAAMAGTLTHPGSPKPGYTSNTPRPPSRCRPSHRRTPGTNGAKKWIFSCLSLALRWTWEMFGDFRMYVIKTVAVLSLFPTY
ncbi:Lymphoid-restricted membrane protein [Dissostichus eleginoides]|uniref:Lymphoid-restricted membrane protein n=1 Tax=Dissostichus eleginoides TaxID=100907 RepID=A0AAD9C103_DISEL|nr:Lymphoid-restricted membrane protein [Dissostichus eleginoides]